MIFGELLYLYVPCHSCYGHFSCPVLNLDGLNFVIAIAVYDYLDFGVLHVVGPFSASFVKLSSSTIVTWRRRMTKWRCKFSHQSESMSPRFNEVEIVIMSEVNG